MILIGIATHKRHGLLLQCLRSLEALTDIPAVEVFVADNDPVNHEGFDLVEAIKEYRFPISAEVVAEPGISAVRNAILRKASDSGCHYLAMIDDDETAEPQWLSSLLEMAKEVQADVVGGPVFPSFFGPVSKAIRNGFWINDCPSGVCEPIYGTGNCLISTRFLYETDWPGFDPEYGLTGGGDREWFTRLAYLGAGFAWSAEAVCHETIPPERRTTRWLLRRQFRIGVDDIRISRCNEPWRLPGVIADAAKVTFLAPVYLLASIPPSKRYGRLGRVARAFGTWSALFGRHYREYAIRH